MSTPDSTGGVGVPRPLSISIIAVLFEQTQGFF